MENQDLMDHMEFPERKVWMVPQEQEDLTDTKEEMVQLEFQETMESKDIKVKEDLMVKWEKMVTKELMVSKDTKENQDMLALKEQ